MEINRNLRKQRIGVVVGTSMNKTIKVTVTNRMKHEKYGKFIMRKKNYLAHDEENTCHEGDTVRIMETRPLSKLKRWRLVEIIERAK
ncbi:MAG: 30S ribosomal protein S17 [Bacteroidales bacterium]|nr:30S ribosomal protein S17 [Bacteroidales bacterium]